MWPERGMIATKDALEVRVKRESSGSLELHICWPPGGLLAHKAHLKCCSVMSELLWTPDKRPHRRPLSTETTETSEGHRQTDGGAAPGPKFGSGLRSLFLLPWWLQIGQERKHRASYQSSSPFHTLLIHKMLYFISKARKMSIHSHEG